MGLWIEVKLWCDICHNKEVTLMEGNDECNFYRDYTFGEDDCAKVGWFFNINDGKVYCPSCLEGLYLPPKEKMTIDQAAVEVVKMAEEEGRVCYLYRRSGKFRYGASFAYWGDWIFKAYPGGRKELRVEGRRIAESEGVLDKFTGGLK
jgi:hypothetical protein